MPPLVFGALGFATWCSAFSGWMLGNACLTGLNMVAALYSVYKIRRTSNPNAEDGEEQEEEEETEEAVRDVAPENDADVEKDEDTDSNHASSEDEDEGSTDHADRTSYRRSSSKGCFSRLIGLKTISSDRIRHLICYNGIFTTYTILFLFWTFWLSDGAQQLIQIETLPDEEMEGCEEFHERYVYVSLVFGFSYFAFVMVAVLISLWS
jgi:hypothetical protein